MVRTIAQGDLDINDRIAGQNAGLSIAPWIPCSIARDVFLGDSAANDGVDELVTLRRARWARLDLDVTVLALTTGLTANWYLVSTHSLADGLAVSNLRSTDS